MIWLDTSSDGASPWRIRYTVKSPGKILLVVKNRVFRFFSLKSPYFRDFLAVRADVPTRPASNHPLLTKINLDPYLFSIPVCKNSQKTLLFRHSTRILTKFPNSDGSETHLFIFGVIENGGVPIFMQIGGKKFGPFF